MPDIFMQNNTKAIQKSNLCRWDADDTDQKPAFILRRWETEREDRWAHGRLLLGGVTTKPAATGDWSYLMLRLCPSRPDPTPPGAGAGMPSETWVQDSFLSSRAPSEAEHLVPKEGGGSYRGRWGLGWSAEPLLLWMSASYTWLTFLSTLCPPCLPPLIPLLFCCLALSCQTEKWQARQRSSAWGDGQESTGAYAHKCINRAYFRQHLSNWEHVVTLNIFTLLWLHIQMHLRLCQNLSP